MKSKTQKMMIAVLAAGFLLASGTGLSAFTTWWAPFGDQYLPAVMYAHGNLNDECGDYYAFVQGARAWNVVSCSDFRFAYGGIRNRTVPSNDDLQVVKWDTCDPGVLGVTYLVTNGPNRECDMIMCTGWDWNCGPGPTGWSEIDIQSVVCHELGHVLGLGHSSYTAATMYAYMNYGDDSKRTLHFDDIDGLCYLYP